MDKQTFLESGLLELYVLGVAEPEDEAIVEQHLNLYPELQQEVEEMRRAIQLYASQQNIPSISERVEASNQIATSNVHTPSYGRVNWLNIWVIGSLALLCILTAVRMQHLQHENHELKGLVAACESREHILAFLKDPATQPVILTHIQDRSQSAALVYWNKNSHKAMLNPFNLPQLPQNEQYQIWADVAGKMISIGLVGQNLEKYEELKYLENAASLNITIEPKGGSKEPTVSRLVASKLI